MSNPQYMVSAAPTEAHSRPPLVLGVESSCDETGVALVTLNTQTGAPLLLGQALHTQVAMHAAYGGVVPELASRDHIRRVVPLLRQALAEALVELADVDAIAYTAGPGLAGALLVGSAFAEALAFALNKPVLPVHHLEGHLLSPLLADRQVDDEAERSRLEDLDLIKGISDFQNQQTGLQAAMAAYSQVQKLSLFQYVT